MKFIGAPEVGIIIVIALIIFGVVRMRRLGQNTAEENETPVRRQRTREVPKRAQHPRIQILGFIFILVGALVLLSNIRLGEWVAWAPIWALVITIIGLVTIFIARRR